MRSHTFTVDNSGSPENYVVKSICKKIVVYEDAQAGTTDYKVYLPPNSATPVTKPAGSKFELEQESPFLPGGPAPFALETAAGSVTFAGEES